MNKAIPRISNYGLIGNCRTAALVSCQGSIDWCCFPRFDSQSLFASLLDQERGGHYVIQPNNSFESSQNYLNDTNVLMTTFKTKSGIATLCDCFTVGEYEKELLPQHEILRTLRIEEGEMRFRFALVPRSQYGAHSVRLNRIGNWGIQCTRGRKLLLLQSDLAISQFQLSDDGVFAEFVLRAGDSLAFSLVYSDTAPSPLPLMGDAALQRQDETAAYWRRWVAQCTYQGEYVVEVHRSALALKLLTFAPSGAILAAPTTSLPEWIGSNRNWDYRFCWLRDSAFTVRALANLGYLEEANAYLNWLLHATRLTHPKLQVVYSAYGESHLSEEELPHLTGYLNSKPVRIGNGAWNQLQLDLYGEVLDAAHFLLPHFGPVDHETKQFLLGLGRTVMDHWQEPDDGIWELRGGRAHHTHSKVMMWVALDRIQAIAQAQGWSLPDGVVQTQSRIHESIERFGFNESLAHYTKAFHGNDLDASLLVMPLVGYCQADSDRFQSTVRAIQRKLGNSGLIYRYLPGTDGMDSMEGTFLICNFWLAEALARAGQFEQSRQTIEAVLSRMNSVGLLSEEMNPHDSQYLGNYPQAFSHIGLINAAVTLADCDVKRGAA
jgi:GH15 family glucan-1,4-alpha-glucosidase